MIGSSYECSPSWLLMLWWCNISCNSSEIDSDIIVIGVVLCFFGTWICGAIGSTLRVGGV